jgi:serine/threonine protein kinase
MADKMAEKDCTRETAETQRVRSDPATAQIVAHYTLRREIGRGGMSSVHEAEDTRTGTSYAFKLLTLPPALTPGEKDNLIARFDREARTVARLSHPSIVDIHEVGQSEGQHFIVMEFLRGETLRERMARERLTPEEAQKILSQIAGAIDAVHAAGIVHRDIKPTNIMLLPDGTAKLLDFGIACSSDETTITSTGILVGSPSYLSPEQIKGEAGTAATDLWALGVLAYEMLAGHPPFTGQTVASVLYQITNESPARTPGLSIAVQRALRRALDRNPARRYPNAAALVSALSEALSETASRVPIVTPSLPPRSVPLWLPGAVVLLLLLTGFSWTVLQRPPAAVFVRAPLQAVPRQVTANNMQKPVIGMQQPPVARAVSIRHPAALPNPRRFAAAPALQKTKPRVIRFHLAEAARGQSVRTQKPIVRSITRLALPDSNSGDDPEANARARKLEWAQTQ